MRKNSDLVCLHPERVEAGESKCLVARHFNVNESTVRTVLKSTESLKKAVEDTSPRAVSHIMHVSKDRYISKMENALFEWLQDCYHKKLSCSRPVIQNRARDIYKELLDKDNVQDRSNFTFNASRGWLDKFQKRYAVDNRVISGEAASADQEAATAYLEEFKRIVTEGGYSADQVFNADETCLYWKLMPKRTYLAKEQEKLPGFKTAKERVSLLFCTNATGDFKPKPVCIYRSAHPRALKNVSLNTLPVIWRSNKTAWMTRAIFEEWFVEHFCPAVRRYCREKNLAYRGILFLDNCAGHPTNLNDLQDDIKVVFLPPNTTSVLQPLDQDVMCVFKGIYLHHTFAALHTALQQDSELGVPQYWKRFNVLDCIRFIGKSWHETTQNVLNRGWKKLWPEVVADFSGFTGNDMVARVVASARQLPGEGFAEITEEDVNEVLNASAEPMSASAAIDSVQQQESEEEDNRPPEAPSPSLSTSLLAKISSTLYQLSDWISDGDPNVARSEMIKAELERALKPYMDIYKHRQQSRKQSSITSFFPAPRTPTPTPTRDIATPSTSFQLESPSTSDVSRISQATTVSLHMSSDSSSDSDDAPDDPRPAPDCNHAVNSGGH